MSRRTRRYLMDRRQMLRAMGLAGAGAMGCGLALPQLAAAQTGRGAPRRVVFILAEMGWVYETLRMRPADAPPDFGRFAGPYHSDPFAMTMPDEDAFELDLAALDPAALSPALQPLARHRARTTVLDGLGMLSVGSSSVVNAHQIGHGAALTGSSGAAQRGAGGAIASIDQRMADHLRRLEPRLTDLAALSFTVLPDPGRRQGVPTYDFRFRDDGFGGAVRVVGETRTAAAVARLAPGTVAPRYGRLRAMRTQIVDALSFEYDRIGRRLGAEDRARLELHGTLLRDLAARDAALGDSVCAVPPGLVGQDRGSVALDYEGTTHDFVDLITMAFGCDIARVASIQLSNPPGELFGAAGDLEGSHAHPSGPDYNRNFGERRAEAVQVMTRNMQWHAEQIARLADRLAALPEGDGTVLDNTAIVWVNEMTHGNHEFDQWPAVVVGGLGGALRTGRYIRLAQTNPTVFGRERQFCGVPHTRLLSSLWAGMELGELDFGGGSVRGVVSAGPQAGISREIRLGGRLDALMA